MLMKYQAEDYLTPGRRTLDSEQETHILREAYAIKETRGF
jgi:hypothetical protein